MWEIFEIAGEINSGIPWLYRGWAFLLSGKYRKKCFLEWKQSNTFSAAFDILTSLAFMLAELVLIYYLYLHLTT